ncbi:lytic transglycosylase domain-containing protein [Candidatus Woesearchaeota archaeon]|nr:lytic transglycosylase domain-containing protein [Candidatus Woesearchaeota archaeon]
MKKIILVWIIALFALGAFVQGACDDYDKCGTQEDRAKWIDKNIGIKIVGDSFYYNKESNSLTLTFGSSAEIPADFLGKVRVVDATATLKDSGAVFTGKGTYSKQLDGFSIEKGVFSIKNSPFNGLPIENSNGVKYNQYSSEISGVAGDNSRVLEQKIGKNTKFFYNEKTNTIRFEGDSKTTTLPGADIVFDGKGYKFSKSDKRYIDFANSNIYVLPRQEETIFDGIKLMAENRPVRFSFVEDDLGYTLTPVRNFVVLGTDKSISDVFKEAGYGSNNFEARKIKYEETFPGETYRSANNADQNIKLLNALKNGDAEIQYKDSNVQIRVPNVKWNPNIPPNTESNTNAEVVIRGVKFNAEIPSGESERFKRDIGLVEKTNIPKNQDIVNRIELSSLKVDKNLVKAIFAVESKFDPYVGPSQGNHGIGHLNYIAVKDVNQREVYGTYDWNEVKKDKYTATDASMAVLTYLTERFNGNLQLIAAGYSKAGPTRVAKERSVPDVVIVPGYTTRDYVKEVMAYYNHFKNNPQ